MRVHRRVIVWFVVLCAVLAGMPPALAWGARGHQIVAMLAERQLTPAALATVHELLAARGAGHLAAVANWPDALREIDPEEFQRTRRLHYVDFGSADCRYDPPRDCPDGQCVVAAIARYSAILADRTRPPAERAEALAFVAHFVGDVHQPLHADYRRDAGGNRYQVHVDQGSTRLGAMHGRGTNLHRVWDSLMVEGTRLTAERYVLKLMEKSTPAASGGTPVQWAEEGCRLDRDGGVYPHAHRIGDAYVERELPIADMRLREAGARLAEMLNRDLAQG